MRIDPRYIFSRNVRFPPKHDTRHFPIESGSGLLWTRCPLRSIALGTGPGNAESLKFLPPSQLGRLKLLARDLFPESPSFAAQRPATAFATAKPLIVILEGGTAGAVVPNYQANAWSHHISYLLKAAHTKSLSTPQSFKRTWLAVCSEETSVKIGGLSVPAC